MLRCWRCARVLFALITGEVPLDWTTPPWPLAQKQSFDATNAIRDNDAVGRFFLVLAVAYNDLKGVLLLERHILQYGRPPRHDFTERAGEWRGVATQVHRLLAGIMHEVLEAIGRDWRLVPAATKTALVESLEPMEREAWQELEAAARPGSGHGKVLKYIRTKGAFHYDPDELMAGYRRQFVDDAKTKPHPSNTSLQYSIGRSMAETRFYFADGAAQRLLLSRSIAGEPDRTDTQLVKFGRQMNRGVAPMIASFIRLREAAII
jgi:hypothetical protein